MIFVTVGTHEDPFDRLVRAAEHLAARERVVLQKGTSTLPTPRCDAVGFMDPAGFTRALQEARIVVAHAGPSTLLEAAEHGHVPIVVPRRPDLGEHVDLHQVRFARRIADRVHVVEDPRKLAAEIDRHDAVVRGLHPLGADPERTEAFCADLEALCERIVAGGASPAGVRDRLRGLRRWMTFRR